ncbi:MAG: GNAT family N-acetyltransferase [Acidimicrobiaceae bacterium]|nr:GNAT family N-acetyltransferase [Acidimicrobiaceae bacterium]
MDSIHASQRPIVSRSIELVRKSDSDLEMFLEVQFANYIAERVASGESESKAREIALEQRKGYFPNGERTDAHRVYTIKSHPEGEIGDLWIGRPEPAETSAWWIYFIGIHPEFRRRGFARLALSEVEKVVLNLGGSRLGLNVFGTNSGAKSLYLQEGYIEVSAQMAKQLLEPA